MKMYTIEIFANEGGDITIKQEGPWPDEDSIIVISTVQASEVCSAIMDAAKEIGLNK